MGEDDDQALKNHAKNRNNKKEDHSHKNKIFQKKDLSQLRCFTCDEKGHFAKECPKKEEWEDGMINKYHSIIQNDVWI